MEEGRRRESGVDWTPDGTARCPHRVSPVSAGDSKGKSADIEVMYARNMKEKANLMKDMGYSDAELHAIVSPSIEDLHFISNAMTQGKIVAVEKNPVGS